MTYKISSSRTLLGEAMAFNGLYTLLVMPASLFIRERNGIYVKRHTEGTTEQPSSGEKRRLIIQLNRAIIQKKRSNEEKKRTTNHPCPIHGARELSCS